MKKISLDEVARSLGVSKTLVSLVLNNKGDAYGISKETQKKVLKKARELNYRPNLVARGLRTGQSNIIGLIVADIANPFYSKIARSIEDKAQRHGYHLMICSSDEDPERESGLIDLLIEGQNVNGLIISTTQQKTGQLTQLKKSGYPLVLIDRYLPQFSASYVGVDNFLGAQKMTEHLINLGYRKIGLLTITPNFLSSINDRVAGYKEALKKHNIRFDPKLVRDIPFNSIQESIGKELRDLMAPPHRVDAVFMLNNNLCAYGLEYLHEAGWRIPNDLAVVSFDDVEFFKFSNPPVTAVAQPLEAIGHKAVELLLEQIRHKGTQQKPKTIELDTELVIRRSCGYALKKG